MINEFFLVNHQKRSLKFVACKNRIFGKILEKSEFFVNLPGILFTRIIHDPQIYAVCVCVCVCVCWCVCMYVYEPSGTRAHNFLLPAKDDRNSVSRSTNAKLKT